MGRFVPTAPLMVSTDNEKHISKIPSLPTDTVILNLEDGVGDKKLALENAKKILRSGSREKRLVVRINALDEGGEDEIVQLEPLQPDAIRVPKISSRKDVLEVENILKLDTDIHLSVETAGAWRELADLKTSDRVTTLYLGILDLFADLGLNHKFIDPENPTAIYILSHFLVTSKSMGVTPVSFVFQDYKNETLFKKWLNLEKSMGFESKGALSPTQAKMIREVLYPETRDLERAKEIIKLFEESSKKGVNGFSHNEFGFIDEPIYKGALALLKGRD
jgi:citrate lyase subunit beta/citryl-CoA lyase